jgi:PEP-CTERM motif-containing protein
VGTDIVGNGAFNGAFTLTGSFVPEPPTFVLAAVALVALMAAGRRLN